MTLQIWKPRNHRTNFPTVFDEFFNNAWNEERSFVPSVDVHEEKDKYMITADLPGLEKKDINIEVKNGILTLSGERKEEQEQEDKSYYRKEIRQGSFCRSFNISDVVDEDRISAEFKNGQLRLSLPKLERVIKQEEVRQITVN